MTWELKIRHTTGYRYRGEVHSSYNEARVTPLSTDRQIAVEAAVVVTPSTPTHRYWDYWGTLVDAFDLHEPHDEMSVVGTSVVETSAAGDQRPSASWEELHAAETVDGYAELLAPTTFVPSDNELDRESTALAALSSPVEAVDAAVDWAHRRLEYAKGITTVRTTATDAFRLGAGVCQDFAHLTLAVLRPLGIPARYVSGYLYPGETAQVGMTTVGESHAWVEAWTGEWWGIDPTHDRLAGERHVVVGRGRDYGDVTPLKGIYHGAPASGLTVSVEITRLE